jgi:DNA-binding SARP family transcriptional activator
MVSGGNLPAQIQAHVEATVRPFLETRQYELAAQLLHDARVQAADAQLEALASVLLLAEQICQLCQHCSLDGQHHQEAYQESLQRETELQHQLLQFLSKPAKPLVGLKPFDTDISTPLAAPVQTISSAVKANWWQRVKASIGWANRVEAAVDDKLIVQDVLLPAPMLTAQDTYQEEEQETTVESAPSAAPQVEADAGEDSVVETVTDIVSPPVAEPLIDERAAVLTVIDRPSLIAYCLGTFRLYEGNQLINNWSSRKGKQVLKYLLLHRQYPVSKEILMETFWPGSDLEAARNNLNVAIYGLRQALRNGFPHFSHVVFRDESYGLNPELVIWIDVEEFQQLLNTAKTAVRRGSTLQAVQEFEAAAAHYQGELLAEDRYEEWLLPIRQRLHDDYLNALDYVSNYYYEQNDNRACIAVCREMLIIEPAYEAIHRRLMRAYARQNQHYLALRQYQQCVESLRSELDVAPDPKTTQLFEKILRRDHNDSN